MAKGGDGEERFQNCDLRKHRHLTICFELLGATARAHGWMLISVYEKTGEIECPNTIKVIHTGTSLLLQRQLIGSERISFIP